MSIELKVEPTVQDVFWSARASIIQHGWCQDDWSIGRRMCLLLSVVSKAGIRGSFALDQIPVSYLNVLDVVLADQWLYRRIRREVAQARNLPLSDPKVMADSITNWNDTPGRRPHEVLEVLLAAGRVAELLWVHEGIRKLLLAANTPTSADSIAHSVVTTNTGLAA